MRATLRRNGKHMLTVRVEHHIDADTVRWVFIGAAWGDQSDEITTRDLTRTAAETLIRDDLRFYGHDLGGEGRAEMISSHHDYRKWVAWADRQIERLWPELTEPPAAD